MSTAIQSAVAAGVAAIARLLANAGLVEAFGHVSARLPSGGFIITATSPLGAATEDNVHVLDGQGQPAAGAVDVPLEAPLHAAIYAARPDVSAICRTHSRHIVAYGARGIVPPLLHGLGGLAGQVTLHRETNLVADLGAGDRAAAALGSADCLILAANGAVATGRDLASAAVRAYYLEERARVAHDAGDASHELAGAALQARAQYFEAESARAWRWMAWRFGLDPTVYSSPSSL